MVLCSFGERNRRFRHLEDLKQWQSWMAGAKKKFLQIIFVVNIGYLLWSNASPHHSNFYLNLRMCHQPLKIHLVLKALCFKLISFVSLYKQQTHKKALFPFVPLSLTLFYFLASWWYRSLLQCPKSIQSFYCFVEVESNRSEQISNWSLSNFSNYFSPFESIES